MVRRYPQNPRSTKNVFSDISWAVRMEVYTEWLYILQRKKILTLQTHVFWKAYVLFIHIYVLSLSCLALGINLA